MVRTNLTSEEMNQVIKKLKVFEKNKKKQRELSEDRTFEKYARHCLHCTQKKTHTYHIKTIGLVLPAVTTL